MSDRSAPAFFISAESAHNHIGECCISYLQMDQPDLPMQCFNDYPLFRYSAEYWFTHAKIIESGAVKVQRTRNEDPTVTRS
jgi:hypothetical protein